MLTQKQPKPMCLKWQLLDPGRYVKLLQIYHDPFDINKHKQLKQQSDEYAKREANKSILDFLKQAVYNIEDKY